MAKKLKDYYGNECIKLWADKLSEVYSKFDSKAFTQSLQKEIKGKEFLDRQDAFAVGFETYLTDNYARNLKIFEKTLGPELQRAEGMFREGWWLWPLGRYIERNAVQSFDASIDFIYELTKRFTGEFAIRPLLVAKPKQAMKVMLRWSKDPNVHVRRLASEGVRIRLPWAKKINVALDEFETFEKILSNLNADPEKFVQKSVGNNLNDLMKESPKHAQKIIQAWQKKKLAKPTEWIIKHGCRNCEDSHAAGSGAGL